MRSRAHVACLCLLAVCLIVVSLTAAGPKGPEPAAVVKVYSLADLVAPIRIKRGEATKSSLTEWSTGLQSDAENQLSRLTEILQLALPKEIWDDGSGAIVAYPEKLSLVIRQSPAGHQAIDELLKQLRAGDDFEIELKVEVYRFDQSNDDDWLNAMRRLGHVMTSDEIADLRKLLHGAPFSITVRLGNGRTAVGGGLLFGLMPRFTAVAAADRTAIDLRLDNISDDIDGEGNFPWKSQAQTIPVDRTAGMLVECDGGAQAYLVTPRIVPRRM